MIRFAVLCAEFSDDLQRMVNEWITDMETASKESRVTRALGQTPQPMFKLIRWQVTHNGEMTYWTAEYTL